MIYFLRIYRNDQDTRQAAWIGLIKEIDTQLATRAQYLHLLGRWVTTTDLRWQSVCWAFEVNPINEDHVQKLRNQLSKIAVIYDQKAIYWTESEKVECLYEQP